MYSDRIVVFIDILGFRSMVKNSYSYENEEENKAEFSRIEKGLKIILENYEAEIPNNMNRQATVFSDSAIVSFEIHEESEVFFTLLNLLHLQMELLREGILCRGALVQGKCIHGDIVFGPAIIEAYDMEKKAIYPRIIVDERVIQTGMHYAKHTPKAEGEYLKEILLQDTDGKIFINYFDAAIHELDDPELGTMYYVDKLKVVIENGLHSNQDNPCVYEKYEWMKNYYNERFSWFHKINNTEI